MSEVQHLPGKITLDLDTVERADAQPPFVVNVNGREIRMEDPEELDWRDLILLENPTEFLRLALSKEDRKFLYEQELPGWKFNKLMEAYYSHFELDEKVQAAQRKQRLTSV